MKYLVFLSLRVFSICAISTDESLDVTPEDVSDAMAKETGLITNGHSMKASFSCTTQDGGVLKRGQKGYEKCMKNVKKNKSDVKVKFVK